MATNYKPFRDRKHLLCSALEAAILWEESRIDAGVCEASNGGDLANTEAEIKAYRRYYRHLSGGKRTAREMLNDEFDKCDTVGIEELFNDQKFEGRIKP